MNLYLINWNIMAAGLVYIVSNHQRIIAVSLEISYSPLGAMFNEMLSKKKKSYKSLI